MTHDETTPQPTQEELVQPEHGPFDVEETNRHARPDYNVEETNAKEESA